MSVSPITERRSTIGSSGSPRSPYSKTTLAWQGFGTKSGSLGGGGGGGGAAGGEPRENLNLLSVHRTHDVRPMVKSAPSSPRGRGTLDESDSILGGGGGDGGGEVEVVSSEDSSLKEKRLELARLARTSSRQLLRSIEAKPAAMRSETDTLLQSETIRRWLNKVLVSAGDKPVLVLGNSLHNQLSDGVVLCKVLQIIKGRSIETIGEDISDKELIRHNIFAFLSSVEGMGVPRVLIPFAESVMSGSEPVKVLNCISHWAGIIETQYPEFPKYSVFLDEVSADINAGNLTEASIGNYPKPLKRTKSQINGQVVDWSKDSVAIETIKYVIRARLVIKRFRNLVKQSAHRKNIAQEILSTETVYVRNLETVAKLYIRPLKEAINRGHALISKDEIRAIFSDLEIILAFNTSLLQMLKPRVDNWSSKQTLGDIFVMITTFLKSYTSYVNNYNTALKTLYSIRKSNVLFNSFVKENEKGCHALTSYLILPIQRIPRYELLLNELKKRTLPSHADYQNLVLAAESIHKLAKFIDLQKKQNLGLTQMFNIQANIPMLSKLNINLLQPHRKFLREGQVFVNSEKTESTMYLFNDLFIIAYKKNATQKNYKLKCLIELKAIVEYRFEELEYNLETNTFELVKDTGEVFRITCQDEKDKAKWIKKMKANRDNDFGTMKQVASKTQPVSSYIEPDESVQIISKGGTLFTKFKKMMTKEHHQSGDQSPVGATPTLSLFRNKKLRRMSSEARLENIFVRPTSNTVSCVERLDSAILTQSAYQLNDSDL